MDSFWSDLLEKLLVAFFTLVTPMVVAFLFAQFKLVWARFKAEKPDMAWMLEQAASLAVNAAEQAGAESYFKDKKAYALDVAQKWLSAQGVDIDLSLIDAAIEAAVYEEFNKDKEPKPAQTGFISAGMGEK